MKTQQIVNTDKEDEAIGVAPRWKLTHQYNAIMKTGHPLQRHMQLRASEPCPAPVGHSPNQLSTRRRRQPFKELTKKPQPALQSLGSDGVEVVVSFWSLMSWFTDVFSIRRDLWRSLRGREDQEEKERASLADQAQTTNAGTEKELRESGRAEVPLLFVHASESILDPAMLSTSSSASSETWLAKSRKDIRSEVPCVSCQSSGPTIARMHHFGLASRVRHGCCVHGDGKEEDENQYALITHRALNSLIGINKN